MLAQPTLDDGTPTFLTATDDAADAPAAAPAAAPKRTVPTFAEIKKLQQQAGADLKTCKAALVDHGCDFEAALASLCAQ